MRSKIDASKLELTETIVNIRRVAKTVKGGRNMRFSVTIVVGDGEGHVGIGLGKAQEIPEAVRKATDLCTDSRNNRSSRNTGNLRRRKGSDYAFRTGNRSYRRFFRTYRTGSCRN